MKLSTLLERACVTRRTTRLTVDLSYDKNVSPTTSRKLPNAKNCRVIKTCSFADNEWLLLVASSKGPFSKH